jgi:alkanesulfonate monooxygenase SsuD/methylene tetrahydromethanopterin reductase-like flavin-dependent oxidoreductase (luciferase family)
VLFQAGASETGRNFAARQAEGIFVMAENPAAVPALVDDIGKRLVAAGRQRRDAQIIQGLSFVVGSTEEEAQAKAADLEQYIDREAAMAQSSGVFGIDLSEADPETRLVTLADEGRGVRGMLRFFIDSLPNGEKATVADLGQFVATRFRVVGTPETIADQIEEWGEAGIDGINIIQWTFPDSYSEFVDHVAPELQKRGLMQSEYRDGTLREKLFPHKSARLAEPHPAAGHRHEFARPTAAAAS